METIVLGGGCFWCLEAAYQLIKGVTDVTSGYAGGHVPNPTDMQVYSGTTGHAEVVQVTFDPKDISLQDILDIFWTIHDPTTLNRQGNDVGPEYRSAIFYATDLQKTIAGRSKQEVANLWPDPITTEITKLDHFYPAGKHHQNFFAKHPEQAYCQLIINPKLEKLRRKFAGQLV